MHYEQVESYQVVIRPDAKQFPEVAEGHGSICFKAEIWEMMGWSEVAAFTEVKIRIQEIQDEKTVIKLILKQFKNSQYYNTYEQHI